VEGSNWVGKLLLRAQHEVHTASVPTKVIVINCIDTMSTKRSNSTKTGADSQVVSWLPFHSAPINSFSPPSTHRGSTLAMEGGSALLTHKVIHWTVIHWCLGWC
jgi:hypothetical protein